MKYLLQIAERKCVTRGTPVYRGMLMALLLTLTQAGLAGAHFSWMYLGMSGANTPSIQMPADQPQFESATEFTRSICNSLPGLVAQQIQVCLSYPNTIPSVTNGARRAIQQCQWQFRNERWNCSTQIADRSNTFEQTLLRGSKETAFVYAITSAGVVHALTQACSSGNLTACTCDRSSEGKSTPQGWKWGGCSDDVQYGMDFARQFVDAPERALKAENSKKLMNLHNNEAGRLAVRSMMKMQCRCHGVSGSCELKTCWRKMPKFTSIGDFLKKRYRRSIEVSGKRRSLRRKRGRDRGKRSSRPPRRRELVYLKKSPNYCLNNPKRGILGTQGRQCQKRSTGPDSCDLLCCGRGYNTKVVRKAERCDCKFVWCCKVHCKTCITLINTYTCK